MICEIFGDVSFRECIAAALGFSAGLLIMVLGTIAFEEIGKWRALRSYDPHKDGFEDEPVHFTGHRNQFRR